MRDRGDVCLLGEERERGKEEGRKILGMKVCCILSTRVVAYDWFSCGSLGVGVMFCRSAPREVVTSYYGDGLGCL